jgi:hypothetical protein
LEVPVWCSLPETIPPIGEHLIALVGIGPLKPPLWLCNLASFSSLNLWRIAHSVGGRSDNGGRGVLNLIFLFSLSPICVLYQIILVKGYQLEIVRKGFLCW